MIAELKHLGTISVVVAGVVLSTVACGTTTTEVDGSGEDVTGPVPLPPPGGSQDYPNEPDGFTVITTRGFSALDEDGWRHVLRTGGKAVPADGGPLYRIVEDPTAPASPNNVGLQVYTSGVDGGEPAKVERDFPDRTSRRLYVSTWMKLSENWQGHQTRVNKLFYFRVGSGTNVWRWLLSAHGTDGNSLPLSARVHQDNGRWLYPNVGDAGDGTYSGARPSSFMERGRWHRIEVVLVANTGGAANGQFHMWVNGVKTAEYNDVWYIDEGELGFHAIEWTPVWGGHGDTLLQEQYMWVDGFYVSGSP